MRPVLDFVKEDYQIPGGLKVSEVDGWEADERQIYTAFLLQPDIANKKNRTDRAQVRDLATGQLWRCTIGRKPERVEE